MLDYVFWWTDWSKCSRNKSIEFALDKERKYVEHPAWVEAWSDRLVPVSQAIQWVWDRVHPEIKAIKIDYYDTWSMDHTLSPIILPMLRQLKEVKHGSPHVDDEDVPDGLGEMIFAFECKVNESWQDAFREGDHDILWVPVDAVGNEVPKGEHKFYQMKDGPKNTYKCDYDGMKKVETRIQNGFRLFGKYYQALWD
jgi:hypothetical protein